MLCTNKKYWPTSPRRGSGNAAPVFLVRNETTREEKKRGPASLRLDPSQIPRAGFTIVAKTVRWRPGRPKDKKHVTCCSSKVRVDAGRRWLLPRHPFVPSRAVHGVSRPSRTSVARPGAI